MRDLPTGGPNWDNSEKKIGTMKKNIKKSLISEDFLFTFFFHSRHARVISSSYIHYYGLIIQVFSITPPPPVIVFHFKSKRILGLPNFRYTFEFFVSPLRYANSSSGVRRAWFTSSGCNCLASLYTYPELTVDLSAMVVCY